MALFTDGPMATVSDLADHESGVLGLSSVESIDLTRKLALAQEEIGVELAALLPRADSFDRQFLHQGTALSTVVATPALRLWHVFHTLELVYRDAYYNQLNERYQGKWKEYAELSRRALDKLMEIGVGIAAVPVAQAAPPTITTVSGSLTAGVYYVTAAWLNAGGEEGASAELRAVTVAANKTFQVAMGTAPANAVSWNVYVGTSPDGMVKQNGAALGPTETFVQPATLVTTGSAPGMGQTPSYLRALPRILQRG